MQTYFTYQQPQLHLLACASYLRPASCPAALEVGQGCGHLLALAGPTEKTKARSGGNSGPKD